MLDLSIVWQIFHVLVVVGLSMLLLCAICMAWYDIKEVRKLRALGRKSKSFKPAITLLVPAYNEELVVVRCLESIKSLEYSNFKVVVVNDASKDKTSSLVREFVKQNPELPIRLVDLKNNRGKGGALNYVLERYCDTPLFMVLDADCTVHKLAVANAVKYFKDRKVMGLATHVRVAEDPTLLSYLQKIEYIAGYRHKKYFSVTNSEFIIGGQGATYRTKAVKEVGGFDEQMLTEDIALSLSIASNGNKANRLVYAHDVITYTEAVPDLVGLYRQRYRWKFGGLQAIFKHRELVFSRSKKYTLWLTWQRIPQALFGEVMLLVEPLLLTLFIIIAIQMRSPAVFFGSWFTLTAYLLFIILIDEYSTLKEKLKMLFVLPVIFPLFYTLTILNVVAMGKCILNWRKIVGLDPVRGTWVSPTRLGKVIASN